MASSGRGTVASNKVENGKNEGTAMETKDKVEHVPGVDPNDSDEEYHEPGMRVGSEYQATIPEMVSDDKDMDNARHCALLVWAPAKSMTDSKLDEYLRTAKDKHGYNVEQALGMLFWHKHNIEKSLTDLANFTPFPDEWSLEDKVLFEQAFGSHGKSFRRIQQMLPDKSVSSLVKYYYSWKKTRSRTSLIDRQARRLAIKEYTENSDTSDSDFEPEKEQRQSNGQLKPRTPTKQPSQPPLMTTCANFHCGNQTQQINATPKGNLCGACYQHWRRTGGLRQPRLTAREERALARGGKIKRKPPKGMSLSQDLLQSISLTHGDAHTRPLEMEFTNLKRQIQNNKQFISQHKGQLEIGIEDVRMDELGNKINAKWTNEELLLAVQCMPGQPPPLMKPSVVQQRPTFPNQSRMGQSGSPLQGPPPLIKPAGRPMQTQDLGRTMAP
ncbi:REST corepressor 3 isoform X2 [Nematostella vectensis]|uniref:REST corepressor 3 isoform X2 n=1 Tax=Nematostella vectensis TaxID=45351 RepID=UPI00207730E5|nr:REST corepressor 3 isoform X2 [Nematostella vectensis]